MRPVVYSMQCSLDGFIAGPDGGFEWSAPDDEVFQSSIDEIKGVDVHLLGRRLYETMLYWETADQDPALSDPMREWAALWKPLPKVVFSTTLSAVRGNARLASGGPAEEIERLRAEPGEGDIAIGGATLAAEAAASGLVDEYRAKVHPVLVGGGTVSAVTLDQEDLPVVWYDAPPSYAIHFLHANGRVTSQWRALTP